MFIGCALGNLIKIVFGENLRIYVVLHRCTRRQRSIVVVATDAFALRHQAGSVELAGGNVHDARAQIREADLLRRASGCPSGVANVHNREYVRRIRSFGYFGEGTDFFVSHWMPPSKSERLIFEFGPVDGRAYRIPSSAPLQRSGQQARPARYCRWRAGNRRKRP